MNESFDFEETERKTNDLFRNLRRNAHIERFSLNSHDFVNENLKNFENVKFFNINEPRVMKKKNRSKDFTNKKDFITRV